MRNNGILKVKIRIDGRHAFTKRLGRWSDPVIVTVENAIAAQILSDCAQGTFDRSLMEYLLPNSTATYHPEKRGGITCYHPLKRQLPETRQVLLRLIEGIC